MKLKRLTAILSLVSLLLLSLSLTVFSFEMQEPAEIDWEHGLILVRGEGVADERYSGGQAKLLARRAAQVDAYRNAAEFIDGVKVSSESTTEMMMLESDRVQTNVQGFIQGAVVADSEYDPHMKIATVTLELPLEGRDGLAYYLEDEARNQAQDRIDDVEEHIEPRREEPEREFERDSEVTTGVEYTGVIIDARGFNVETALYPQIFDTDGYSIYGPTEVSPDAPSGVSSLVAYARSEASAKEIDRVGENPLLIDATSVINRTDEAATDLILNSDNARLFRELDENHGIVDYRAVVFIID